MTPSSTDLTGLTEIISRHHASPLELLQILRDVQSRFRHISRPAMRVIADRLNVPLTQVQAVTEFYSFLTTEPVGLYDIRLSDSITDHMAGSLDMAAYLCKRLDVVPGRTRPDGLVSFSFTSCTGMCDQGPAALVNGYAITKLDYQRIDQLVRCVETALPVQDWPVEWFRIEDNIHRQSLLLETASPPGSAIRHVLDIGREAIFSELDRSGLRGRGGAGFKTSLKWRYCADSPLPEQSGLRDGVKAGRVVVCNADEGEPGTFKDRVLLNRHAHEIFEGMTICAALIDARQGFLYLRGEYLYFYDTLQELLASRRQQGLLGRSILGREGFDFDIHIHLGAGAYICGEESALIESLEGKRGNPRNRPPYPVTHGYLGQPTVVNNVETFLAAARIALNGGEWFAALGTPQSSGTKVLSISGDCDRPGIYEYPFGTRITEILADCGATDTLGIQIGGPSGTFIAAGEFTKKLAFEELATGGSFIIFDQSRDVLEIARNFTHFFAHESCGFCTPCRVGTSLLRELLDKVSDGHGTPHDLVELTHIAGLVMATSHCGLGQTAANPVLHTLQRFPERYEQRLRTVSFEPGFDLDGALADSRRLSHRDDPQAHLEQTG